jgi:hypothetical protein
LLRIKHDVGIVSVKRLDWQLGLWPYLTVCEWPGTKLVMTNDQARMTNEIPIPNDQNWTFGIWSLIGHSGLVIDHSYFTFTYSRRRASYNFFQLQ